MTQNWQFSETLSEGNGFLPVLSPFFQKTDTRPGNDRIRSITRKTGAGRVKILENMKALIGSIDEMDSDTSTFSFMAGFINDSTGVLVEKRVLTISIGIDFTVYTQDGLKAIMETYILNYASSQSYSMTASDIIWEYPIVPTPNRTFVYPTLAVNTARQASTTRDALVVASVEIDASLSLTTGAKGTVSLQYADNNTFTTNLKTAGIGVNGNTGTLVIGLNTVGAGGGCVVGIIPAGKYYRLLTTNTTGTPTYGTPAIQEVLL